MNPALKFLLLVALVLPFGASAATLSVRNIDNEDLLVKYEGLGKGQFEIHDARGDVLKEASIPKSTGRKSIALPNDVPGGVYALVVQGRDGREIARTTFTVRYPAPTCRATLSQKVAEKGDFVTLRWKSEHADRAHVFKTQRPSGSESIALHHAGKRVFAVNVFGKGGASSCRAEVTVAE